MFRIGEFSRIAQVSCRLLRHYDELGLLRPSHVDADTGYRFYQAAQLTRLSRILVLRDLGFSLDQIARMVDGEAELSSSELRAMLRMRHAEVERDLAAQATRLELIEQRIADSETGGVERGEVVLRAEPAVWFLAHRAPYGSFAEARARVQALLRETLPTLPFELGRLMVLQHATAFEPDELDLEIGFVAASNPEAPPPTTTHFSFGDLDLALRLLPRHDRMATIVRVGTPEVAHRQTAAIARELQAGGYRLDGPNREVFLRNPGPKSLPVVEMQYPIRRP